MLVFVPNYKARYTPSSVRSVLSIYNSVARTYHLSRFTKLPYVSDKPTYVSDKGEKRCLSPSRKRHLSNH